MQEFFRCWVAGFKHGISYLLTTALRLPLISTPLAACRSVRQLTVVLNPAVHGAKMSPFEQVASTCPRKPSALVRATLSFVILPLHYLPFSEQGLQFIQRNVELIHTVRSTPSTDCTMLGTSRISQMLSSGLRKAGSGLHL